MEQKPKFIIIGLIGALAIFLVLFMATFSQKQRLMKEKEELQKENATLSAKIEELNSSLSEAKRKVVSLQTSLDDLSREKAEVDRRLDLANKAKDELVAKLKELQAKQVGPQVQTVPQTDAYWGGVLKAKTDLELQLGNMSSQLKSLQINNEQLQREKSSLEIELSGLKREKEDLKREIDYNKKILDSISQELVRERNDKIQIQDSFKIIRSENTVLTRQLESLNNKKINLEKRLVDLGDEKDTVERRFNEMQTMLTDKISQINGLREELDAIRQSAATGEAPVSEKRAVELPPIVVRPQSEKAQKLISAPYQGKVLAINKESNFVIVDLGEDAGVRSGDTFQVYKDDKAVATVEAIQVRKSISACDIKRQTAPIGIGDSVR